MGDAPQTVKYATKADVDIAIQILIITRDKLPEVYNREKIYASINRVIMDLEEFKSIFNGDKTSED